MLNVRVSDEEMAMLSAVAEAEGLSQSDIIRQLLRRAFYELQKTPKPKPKRR